MAIRLTIGIDYAGEGPHDSPEDINRLADDILSVADKHSEFYLYRIGDAIVVPDEK